MRCVEAVMSELVSHAGNIDPGDPGLGVQHLRTDPLHGFTYFDESQTDGIEHQAIIESSTAHVVCDRGERSDDVLQSLLIASAHSGIDCASASDFTLGRRLSAGTTSTGTCSTAERSR